MFIESLLIYRSLIRRRNPDRSDSEFTDPLPDKLRRTVVRVYGVIYYCAEIRSKDNLS